MAEGNEALDPGTGDGAGDPRSVGKEIKCVIWDLDNTLWEGTLVEDQSVTLKPGIREILATLDGRGILNSIASRNDHDDAMEHLQRFEIDHYFLYPEINWGTKSESIARIQKNLNIGMDTLLFIDDQPFERDEVQSIHSQVTCIDAAEYDQLVEFPRLNPKYITTDSRRRRLMYLENMQRETDEGQHEGPREEFLAAAQMRFSISHAQEVDLQRAEELTERTNQLNATGRTYSYDELNALRLSENHQLLVCELTDRYGSYGKIGLALVEMEPEVWHLRLLLMSCRVMNRGVGTVLLSYLLKQAKKAGVRFLADFVPTKRNRMMYVAYKFANFTEISEENGVTVLENDLSKIQEFPTYLELSTPSD